MNDAMVAALVREPDPDRRHLIVALTDSIDTMSTLGVPSVREVARQANATLVIAWITLSEDASFVAAGGRSDQGAAVDDVQLSASIATSDN